MPPTRTTSPSRRRRRAVTRSSLTHVPLRERPSSEIVQSLPSRSSVACVRDTRASHASATSVASSRPIVSWARSPASSTMSCRSSSSRRTRNGAPAASARRRSRSSAGVATWGAAAFRPRADATPQSPLAVKSLTPWGRAAPSLARMGGRDGRARASGHESSSTHREDRPRVRTGPDRGAGRAGARHGGAHAHGRPAVLLARPADRARRRRLHARRATSAMVFPSPERTGATSSPRRTPLKADAAGGINGRLPAPRAGVGQRPARDA